MTPTPPSVRHYHVFLASPGDVNSERIQVRKFFENYNRHTAHLWNAHFELIDWENCSTIGVGRPQELITQQTLERFKDSLVLVVGIMAQRFGSPSGVAESGTEEEFNWAMQAYEERGYPEIKWFFRKIEKLEIPADLTQVGLAVEQWTKVCAFREKNKDNRKIYTCEYPGADKFAELLHHDLSLWLASHDRPWVRESAASGKSQAVIPLCQFDSQQYSDAVLKQFDKLNFEMIDHSGANYSGVRLWSVFVPQSVRECHQYNPRLLEIPKEHQDRLLKEGVIDEKELKEAERQADSLRREYFNQPIRPVLDVTDGARLAGSTGGDSKIVLLGDPGSGKSSLLRYLALRWAMAPFAERDSMSIPIVIDLNKYCRWHCEGRKSLVRFLEEAPGSHVWSPGLLDSLLRQPRRIVLLLDGLDEVFDLNFRNDVISDIQSFTGQYPEAPVIVTSRVVGYQSQRLRDAGFRHFMFQDLSREQINEFIDQWHATTFDDDEQSALKRQRLLKAIDQSKSIAMLAGNPLLLTMMAILNRNQELPRDRGDLYEQASRLLLHQWDTERALAAFPGLSDGIGWREKSAILRQIAFHMQQAAGGLKGNFIDGETLTRLIEIYLREERHVPESQAAAEAVVRHLRERNFILCFVGADSYAFVHRTFLEYFCAMMFVEQFESKKSLTEEGLLALFRQHCAEDEWREVLRLICGKIDEKFVGKIIDHLVSSVDLVKWDGSDLPQIILAVWCLSEARTRGHLVSVTGRLADSLVRIYIPGNGMREFHEHLIEAIKNVSSPWSGGVSIAQKVRDNLSWSLEERWATVFLVHFVVCASPDRAAINQFLESPNYGLRWGSVEVLAERWPDAAARTFIVERALKDDSSSVRSTAVETLADKWPDEATRTFIVERALKDRNGFVRSTAVESLANKWPDEAMKNFLLKRGASDEDAYVRSAAISSLVNKWPDEATRRFFVERVSNDKSGLVRSTAISSLANNWPDEATRRFIVERASNDGDGSVRGTAVSSLANRWPDEATRKFIVERASNDDNGSVLGAAISSLANKWPDPVTRRFIVERASNDGDGFVRRTAIESLVNKWPDEVTRKFIVERASNDGDGSVRRTTISSLASKWPDEAMRRFIVERASNDDDGSVRRTAIESLTNKWPDEVTRVLIVERALNDDDADVQFAAFESLANKWPGEATRILLKDRAPVDGAATCVFGKLHSKFGQILATRDFDGMGPYLDPRKPIPDEQIRRAAKGVGIPDEKIDEMVRSLSEHLGWDIRKGAEVPGKKEVAGEKEEWPEDNRISFAGAVTRVELSSLPQDEFASVFAEDVGLDVD